MNSLASFKTHFRFLVMAMVASNLVSLSAHGEEPPCVHAYREAHAQFFKRMADLRDMQRNAAFGGGGVGAVGLVACIYRTRAPMACSLIFGTIMGGSWYYAWDQNDEMKRLEDARRIYEVYYEAQTGSVGDSEESQELFKALKRTTTPAQLATLNSVGHLMESGVLCDSAGLPSATWEDLKSQLQ